ncbi:ankyrin [Anaeromyces robustus]|uniref:Ankyrin n=1 Tax=Anaeromyces robustus TaxID=1754192 RepID=A0A1Y1XED6_9FUNG|nr:ankyrin [Anaeromyces robustus]|eukprot:ORX84083.1 ankyrin [Anaeromyces robustus]
MENEYLNNKDDDYFPTWKQIRINEIMEKCIEYYDSGQKKLRHIEIDKPKEDIRKKIVQNNRILIENVLFHNFLSIILNKSNFNLFVKCYEELQEYVYQRVSNNIIWVQCALVYSNLVCIVSKKTINAAIVNLLTERKSKGGKIINNTDTLKKFIDCHKEQMFALQEYIYIIQSFIWVYQSAKNEYNDIFPTILSKYDVIINSVRLLAACKERDIESINRLLDEYCIVDLKNNHGETPLDLIIQTGDLHTLKKVLKQCININITDDMGRTSLMKAAADGEVEVVKLLLTHPYIDVNKQDINFQTALMKAAMNGHTDVVRELLKFNGINVNIRNSDGIPVLVATAEKGYFDIVKLLLKYPNINYQSQLSEEFKNTMKYWYNDDNKELIELIKSGRKADVNMNEHLKYSLFFVVVCIGDIEKVKILLKSSRININWKDPSGKTPLMIAIIKKQEEIIELLLKQSKINVNIKDNEGNTALTYAAMYSSSDIIYQLLEYKKISINTQNNFGYTPAMTAAERGNFDAINIFLLNKKVKFNIENEIGETALITAIEKGHYEVVKLILESKRSDIYSGHGDTNIKLLQCAVNSGQAEIVSLFLGNLTIKNGSFYSADDISVNSLGSIRTFNNKPKSSPGLDVMNISTPFFTAAERGYLSIVKLFLDMNLIDINIKDTLNETALIKATINGHVRLVEFLLKQPNINVKQWNVEGLTALDIAQKNGNIEIINLIKQYFKLKPIVNEQRESQSNKYKYYRRSSENLEREFCHNIHKSCSDHNLSSNTNDFLGLL